MSIGGVFVSKLMSVVFALLAGGSTALEAFINGELGKNTTPMITTFISLVIGAIFFLMSILLIGDFNDLLSLKGISPKLLLGGIFGGCIIYFTVKAIPNLGVSNTLTLIVVSQISVGFLIDALFTSQIQMHLYKYIGVILLVIGTFFIVN